MSTMNEIIMQVVQSVDGGLGCAIVDLNSGLLLSVHHTVPYFTQSYLDAVAAAAVDMMRGKNIRAVESLLSNVRGREVINMIKEVQMTTENTFHFMATVPDKPDALLVLITNRKTNLGMGWASLRGALPRLTSLCP